MNPICIGGFSLIFVVIVTINLLDRWWPLNLGPYWSRGLIVASAIWTIAVPFWMFLEVVWGFEIPDMSRVAEYEQYLKELAALKVRQDAAQPAWAAGAAILGVFVLKSNDANPQQPKVAAK